MVGAAARTAFLHNDDPSLCLECWLKPMPSFKGAVRCGAHHGDRPRWYLDLLLPANFAGLLDISGGKKVQSRTALSQHLFSSEGLKRARWASASRAVVLKGCTREHVKARCALYSESIADFIGTTFTRWHGPDLKFAISCCQCGGGPCDGEVAMTCDVCLIGACAIHAGALALRTSTACRPDCPLCAGRGCLLCPGCAASATGAGSAAYAHVSAALPENDPDGLQAYYRTLQQVELNELAARPAALSASSGLPAYTVAGQRRLEAAVAAEAAKMVRSRLPSPFPPSFPPLLPPPFFPLLPSLPLCRLEAAVAAEAAEMAGRLSPADGRTGGRTGGRGGLWGCLYALSVLMDITPFFRGRPP